MLYDIDGVREWLKSVEDYQKAAIDGDKAAAVSERNEAKRLQDSLNYE